MEKIYSAKTLDEAKAKAYAEFAKEAGDDFDKDAVQFEILEQPVKRLFGTKGEFKIKAVMDKSSTILDDIDLFPELSPTQHIAVDDEEDENPFLEKAEAIKIAPAAKPEVETAIKTEAKSFAKTDAQSENRNVVVPSINDPKVQRAVAFLEKVIGQLGVENFKIVPIQKDDMVVLDIVGEKLGVVIGRRGETLDSLQYLAILSGNRGDEPYSRISVDCNGYREKRKQTLETLAKRTAQKVLKQGRRVTLEPMNPYERRIIHSTVSEIEGVFSNSIGEEPYRKVVISAVNARSYSGNRNGGNRNNDRRPRSNNNGGETNNSANHGKPAGRPNRDNSANSGRSYKQSGNYSTSFEREYKRSISDNDEPVEYSKETVETEKNAQLFGKIEL